MAEQLEAYDPQLRPVLAVLKPRLWPMALYIMTGQAVPSDFEPMSRDDSGRVMRVVQKSELYQKKAVRKRFIKLNNAELMLNTLENESTPEQEKIALRYKCLLELVSKIGLGFQSPWAECSAGQNVELAVKRHGQFYPAGPSKGQTNILEAKTFCYKCIVRESCLDYAMANKEIDGIWGGLSERQRRKVRQIIRLAPEKVEETIFHYHSLNLQAVNLYLEGGEVDDLTDKIDPPLVHLILESVDDEPEESESSDS